MSMVLLVFGMIMYYAIDNVRIHNANKYNKLQCAIEELEWKCDKAKVSER